MLKRVIIIAGLILSILAVRQLVLSQLSNNTIFVSGIALGLLCYGWHYERLTKIKWINYCICVFAAAFIGLLVFITLYGGRDNVTYQENAVIVLGAGIRGERVSALLQARLDKAVEYHKKNPDALIIVTGGQGPGENITEALAMERYLLARNIPAASIIKEDQASSTYENMYYSKAILDARMPAHYSAVIITNEFHIYRSVQFAKIMDINCTHEHASTPFYAIPANFTRECAAVIKLWLFKR